MRRIKLLLAALTAMVTMAVLSAPAMAQSYYWDPGWLGNTAAPTSPTTTDTDDNFPVTQSFDEGGSFGNDADDNFPVMQSFDEDGSFGNDCDWVQDSDGDWFQECD